MSVSNFLSFCSPDHDGHEIDFIFVRDDTLFPVEVKLGATPRKAWCRPFNTLSSLPHQRGPGVVVCLRPSPLALSAQDHAIPVAWL